MPLFVSKNPSTMSGSDNIGPYSLEQAFGGGELSYNCNNEPKGLLLVIVQDSIFFSDVRKIPSTPKP